MVLEQIDPAISEMNRVIVAQPRGGAQLAADFVAPQECRLAKRLQEPSRGLAGLSWQRGQRHAGSDLEAENLSRR